MLNSHSVRFNGITRLFGAVGLDRLLQAHVCVVGLSGVGSWAVEALARSAVGHLTLVDLDDVCIGNTNRQLHALSGEFGKPKVEVMTNRVRAINPECIINPVQAFFLKTNADEILNTKFDYVLDAIDSLSMKCLLIGRCRQKGIPIITVGASGGHSDPTAVEVVDLAFSSHDHLLQEVRRKLRCHYAFPRGDQPFGVECVLSREPLITPLSIDSSDRADEEEPDLRLDCNTGFGTASFVTGTFGLIAAGCIVRRIAAGAQMVETNVDQVSLSRLDIGGNAWSVRALETTQDEPSTT